MSSSFLVLKALDLLYELDSDPTLVYHSLHVLNQSYNLVEKIKSKNIKIELNEDYIYTGAILHDIGRTKSQSIDHGVIGGKIIRKAKFPKEIALIAERHIGGGIPKIEAISLGLPKKDYIPESLEEKIVCYADKMVDYKFYKHNTRWWCIKKSYTFTNVENEIEKLSHHLGSSHPAIKRLYNLEEELIDLINK